MRRDKFRTYLQREEIRDSNMDRVDSVEVEIEIAEVAKILWL